MTMTIWIKKKKKTVSQKTGKRKTSEHIYNEKKRENR